MSAAFPFRSFFKQEIGKSCLKFNVKTLTLTDDVNINYTDLTSIQKATNLASLTLKSKHLLLKCGSCVDDALKLNIAFVDTLCSLSSLVHIDIEGATFLWPNDILKVLESCKKLLFSHFHQSG